MAAAQDGGAPRDPARVAQFGRRAGGPPTPRPRFSPGPAPPPGARRAAESGLRAAFVSHRAGRGGGEGPAPPVGLRSPAPRRGGRGPGHLPPWRSLAMSRLRDVRLGRGGPSPAGPRGLAAAGTGAKVRSGAFARAGPGRVLPSAVLALGARVRAVVGVSPRSEHCCRRDRGKNSPAVLTR